MNPRKYTFQQKWTTHTFSQNYYPLEFYCNLYFAQKALQIYLLFNIYNIIIYNIILYYHYYCLLIKTPKLNQIMLRTDIQVVQGLFQFNIITTIETNLLSNTFACCIIQLLFPYCRVSSQRKDWRENLDV